MTSSNLAVFCDFDGTIASRDVGYNMFRHFSGGRNDTLIPGWKSGELSSRDCLRLEAEMVTCTEREFYEYLNRFTLTDGFAEFERLVKSNGVPMAILSDGLDLYIEYILKRYGLSHIPTHSNIGRLENGGLTIEFPYSSVNCTRCGNCKGDRIAEYRQSQGGPVTVVFAGDGYSDTCAIEQTDILFAKKDLEQYCIGNNIPYFSFDTFYDIAERLIEKGLLAPRILNS